jgi:HAD superfamily hydrolase (TIGR01509 family)
MIRAVLFDMDGVLVDSEPLHIEAGRKTLDSLGVSISDVEFRSYMGRTSKIMLTDVIRKYRLNITVQSIYPMHQQNLMRLYNEKVEPIPGISELIADCRKREYKMAVASSSDRVLIQTVLDKFHWTGYFEAVVSGEETERAKPFPDIFLEAARRLNADPSSCAVIEDSTAGVLAAKAAGMVCIGFNSPNSPGQNLSRADLIIQDIPSMNLDYVESLFQ